jgi:hypothetical protein
VRILSRKLPDSFGQLRRWLRQGEAVSVSLADDEIGRNGRKTAMTKTIALALAASLSLGAMQARAAEPVLYPRMLGTGESATIDYGPGPHGNIVGGGVAVMTGGGENASITYVGPLQSQAPMLARAIGSGEDLSVVYVLPPAQGPATAAVLAGKPARQL